VQRSTPAGELEPVVARSIGLVRDLLDASLAIELVGDEVSLVAAIQALVVLAHRDVVLTDWLR
jgi:hypothetical protein